jgi:hypothetical protein
VTDSGGKLRRHVLFLAYYFPPLGLSGVQRASKFAKYLPEYGWDVTVLTAEPRGYFAYDNTLLEDLVQSGVKIVRTRSLDPTRLYGRARVVNLPRESRRRWASALTNIFFVPDNKIGWFLSGRRAALASHYKHAFDAVFSSAPPYTSHLMAASISRRLELPLVLDFRDDWVGNPRHTYPTSLHRQLHERLEHRVVGSASATITINRIIADSLDTRCRAKGITAPIHVIPQGFDPADFSDQRVTDRRTESLAFRFLYSGIFYDAQTPIPFLNGLRLAIEQRPDLRGQIAADFVGLVPDDFRTFVDGADLSDVVNYLGYESHSDIVKRMSEADVLWLTIGRRPGSEGISTGKLYEYFGARRPVLGLVPEGVARDDLVRYGAAEIADPEDVQDISRAIISMFDRVSANRMAAPDDAFVRLFDRRRLAGDLAAILNDAIDPGSQS